MAIKKKASGELEKASGELEKVSGKLCSKLTFSNLQLIFLLCYSPNFKSNTLPKYAV